MAKTRVLICSAIVAAFGVAACRTQVEHAQEPAKAMTNSPDAVLDAMHAAASRADFDRYFALFTPDAVFLGTDPAERWTIEQFQAYARPHFEKGQGWTYVPSDRHVAFSSDGHMAWFDERVTNQKYGECRGTGVLRQSVDGWRIAQYNLTKPIPNDLFLPVVDLIRSGGSWW